MIIRQKPLIQSPQLFGFAPGMVYSKLRQNLSKELLTRKVGFATNLTPYRERDKLRVRDRPINVFPLPSSPASLTIPLGV